MSIIKINADAAKAAKLARLKAACSEAIRAGVVSSALGSPHLYDTDKDSDQLNLVGAGLLGLDIAYTCTDIATGIKAQRVHTAAQMAQVYHEGVALKGGMIGHLNDLRTQLDAATDIAAVDAVVWVTPV